MAVAKSLQDAAASAAGLRVLAGLLIMNVAIYLIILGTYRLYFSPLAKFPGPKLAALTHWVETYYELFKGDGGQFVFEYTKWREQYGRLLWWGFKTVNVKICNVPLFGSTRTNFTSKIRSSLRFFTPDRQTS